MTEPTTYLVESQCIDCNWRWAWLVPMSWPKRTFLRCAPCAADKWRDEQMTVESN